MNRHAMHKLRLDRRLIARKTWMSRAELERELEALADVAHKATTLGEVEDDLRQPSDGARAPE
jgi:hypothetical protein